MCTVSIFFVVHRILLVALATTWLIEISVQIPLIKSEVNYTKQSLNSCEWPIL